MRGAGAKLVRPRSLDEAWQQLATARESFNHAATLAGAPRVWKSLAPRVFAYMIRFDGWIYPSANNV
jgi:hypothetical protein